MTKDKDMIIHLHSSNFETKQVGTKDKSLYIEGYANTVTKDRSGDIIQAEAWAKGVDNYRNNPIVLLQHNHAQSIGRAVELRVTKKGLFVRAKISSAAEDLYKVHTLIKDGALKSFSVGFVIKDAEQDRKSGAVTITDVELHEISIVSVPCNQDSLFSVRKALESDEDYNKFKQEFLDNKKNKDAVISAGITNFYDDHYHTLEVDKDGNGVTTYTSHSGSENHTHQVKNWEIVDGDNHTHTHSIEMTGEVNKASEDSFEEVTIFSLDDTEESTDMGLEEKTAQVASEEVTVTEEVAEVKSVETEDDSEEEVVETYEQPIPFYNLLAFEVSKIKEGSTIYLDNKRWQVKSGPEVQNPNFQLLEIDVVGKNLDNELSINVEEIAIVNEWDLGTEYDLHVIRTELNTLSDSQRETIKKSFEEAVTATELDLFNLKSKVSDSPSYQNTLNKTINLVSTQSSDWTDANYNLAKIYTDMISALKTFDAEGSSDNTKLALELYGYTNISEEKQEMAEQQVDAPVVINTGATKNTGVTETPTAEAVKPAAVVSEPRVAELVAKTGEAIVAEAVVDSETPESVAKQLQAQIDELKSVSAEYREQIAQHTENKMHYQDSASKQVNPFSEQDMANAYLLQKALQNASPYDTKFGARMKAVTTVDAFLSNFSTNVYEEMQQELVIAPMFERIPVDTKNFRIPVGLEDTDGDVAQFASGTYSTGIADTTRVPTTNQHTIGSVELTPHKFMATTHLAKDEEEDTVLPLIGYLRQAATRRMARAIDKAILRGDGSLSGFNASPTNGIVDGAGYAAVFKGVTTLASDIPALVEDTAGSTTKATPVDIAGARAKMGKYGLQLGSQLVYLTTIEGYNELVSFSDFRTVDKFGPQATYLTGAVGAIYGIPLMITEFLDNVGTQDNQLGTLVYRPGFVIGERRAMEVESEYEPRQQVTALYMSTRFDFKALSSNSNAALDATNFAYAAAVEAG